VRSRAPALRTTTGVTPVSLGRIGARTTTARVPIRYPNSSDFPVKAGEWPSALTVAKSGCLQAFPYRIRRCTRCLPCRRSWVRIPSAALRSGSTEPQTVPRRPCWPRPASRGQGRGWVTTSPRSCSLDQATDAGRGARRARLEAVPFGTRRRVPLAATTRSAQRPEGRPDLLGERLEPPVRSPVFGHPPTRGDARGRTARPSRPRPPRSRSAWSSLSARRRPRRCRARSSLAGGRHARPRP
jgi:hypothetical protein